MAEVIVDHEKLVYGLEQGIDREVDLREWPLATDAIEYGHNDYVLRLPLCGLASSAIRAYCRQRDMGVRMMLSEPNLAFDSQMTHVVASIIEANPDDPTVIDPTYSQFFRYVGLTARYELESWRQAFPKKKILHFKQSDWQRAAGWVSATALRFRAGDYPGKEFYLDRSPGFDYDAPPHEVANAYSKIWDPAYSRLWRPRNPRTAQLGAAISRCIPDETITIK